MPPESPLAEALRRVGDRWTLLIVESLLDGPRRFGELQASITGIAPNVLTARLRHLEEQGLLVARPYQERPPRFEYELTAAAADLAAPLRLLGDWGARHGADAQPPRHDACGTPLEVRWWCPSCEAPVDEPGSEEVVV